MECTWIDVLTYCWRRSCKSQQPADPLTRETFRDSGRKYEQERTEKAQLYFLELFCAYVPSYCFKISPQGKSDDRNDR